MFLHVIQSESLPITPEQIKKNVGLDNVCITV